MTLTTHAVVGATVASFFPSTPVLGIAAALASHYLCDRIPHWDYSIQALRIEAGANEIDGVVMSPLSLVDLLKVGIDFLIGISLVLLLLPARPTPTGFLFLLSGALAGMLPDLLQFLYFKFRSRLSWLRFLQRLHNLAHAKIRIGNASLGVALQVSLVLALMLIVYYN